MTKCVLLTTAKTYKEYNIIHLYSSETLIEQKRKRKR